MTDWPRGGYAASNTPASELKPPPASMVSKERYPSGDATYTAAEVKVLTETASKVAYELGRKDALDEVRGALIEEGATQRAIAIVMAIQAEGSRGGE